MSRVRLKWDSNIRIQADGDPSRMSAIIPAYNISGVPSAVRPNFINSKTQTTRRYS